MSQPGELTDLGRCEEELWVGIAAYAVARGANPDRDDPAAGRAAVERISHALDQIKVIVACDAARRVCDPSGR